MASLTSPRLISTGTILPCTRHSSMRAARGLPSRARSALSSSPTLRWTHLYSATMRSDWVPFPAPGPPSTNTTRCLGPGPVEPEPAVGTGSSADVSRYASPPRLAGRTDGPQMPEAPPAASRMRSSMAGSESMSYGASSPSSSAA